MKNIKQLNEEISRVLNESNQYKLSIIVDRNRDNSGRLIEETINANNDADALLQVFKNYNLQNSGYLNGEYADELPEEEIERNNIIENAAKTGENIEEAVSLMNELYFDNFDPSDYYDNIVKLEAPDGHIVIEGDADIDDWMDDEDLEDELALDEEMAKVLNEDMSFEQILQSFLDKNNHKITPTPDNKSIQINGIDLERILFNLQQKAEGNYTFAMAQELDEIEDAGFGSINCSGMGLTSLQGCPEHIEGNFICDNNKIKNLVGGPKVVKGNYSIEGCKELQSLEGLAEEIGIDLIVKDCPELKTMDIPSTTNIQGEIKQ